MKRVVWEEPDFQPRKQPKTAANLLVDFYSDQSMFKLQLLLDAISFLSGVEALALWRCCGSLEGEHGDSVRTALWKRMNQDPYMATREGTRALIDVLSSNSPLLLLQKACLNLVNLDAADILKVFKSTLELANNCVATTTTTTTTTSRRAFLITFLHVVLRDHWHKDMCKSIEDLCSLLNDHVHNETVVMLHTLVGKLSPPDILHNDLISLVTDVHVRNFWAPSNRVSLLFDLVRAIDAKMSPLAQQVVPNSIESIIALLALQPNSERAHVAYCVGLCMRLTDQSVATSLRTMLIDSMANVELRPRLVTLYRATLHVPESFWNHLDNFTSVWRLVGSPPHACVDLTELLTEIATVVSSNPGVTLGQVLKQVNVMDAMMSNCPMHALLCKLTVRALKTIARSNVHNVMAFLTLVARTLRHAFKFKRNGDVHALLGFLTDFFDLLKPHQDMQKLIEATAAAVSCNIQSGVVLFTLARLLNGLPRAEVVPHIAALFKLPLTQFLIDVLTWWVPRVLTGQDISTHKLLSCALNVAKVSPNLEVDRLLVALAQAVEREEALGDWGVWDMATWPHECTQ